MYTVDDLKLAYSLGRNDLLRSKLFRKKLRAKKAEAIERSHKAFARTYRGKNPYGGGRAEMRHQNRAERIENLLRLQSGRRSLRTRGLSNRRGTTAEYYGFKP